jgi:hypothetical protein
VVVVCHAIPTSSSRQIPPQAALNTPLSRPPHRSTTLAIQTLALLRCVNLTLQICRCCVEQILGCCRPQRGQQRSGGVPRSHSSCPAHRPSTSRNPPPPTHTHPTHTLKHVLVACCFVSMVQVLRGTGC